jgi:hypothetical protein
MRNRLRFMAVSGLLSLNFACGSHDSPQDGVYEPDYVLLGSNSYGLSRRAFANRIGVCIDGKPTDEQIRFVDLAFQAWAKPLRDLHPGVKIHHEYDCAHYALKINWSQNSGRASTNISYDTASMELYSNSYFETVQHEFGHAFGLGDTYDTDGQKDSVMRLGRYGEPVLYPNDIAGVQNVFTNIQKRASPPEIYSDEKACEIPDGKAGIYRVAKRGGAERETTCVLQRNNADFSFELTLSECAEGTQNYGLFSAQLDEWLDGVVFSYDCE